MNGWGSTVIRWEVGISVLAGNLVLRPNVLSVGKQYQGSVPSQQQTAGESTVSVQDFQSRHFDFPTAPQCSASITPSEHPVNVALPDPKPWLRSVGVYLLPDN